MSKAAAAAAAAATKRPRKGKVRKHDSNHHLTYSCI